MNTGVSNKGVIIMLNREWIKSNCLTAKGSLNNRVVIDSWWVNRALTDELAFLKSLQSSCHHTSLTETLYAIYNSTPAGVCKICGKNTAFVNFKTGYRKYCSLDCTYQCGERNRKIGEGVDQKTKQEKIKATNLSRYGVERTSKLFAHKTGATKEQRYGNSKYNNITKARETCIERYGVEWATLIPSKIEQTKKLRAEKIPLLRDREFLERINNTHTLIEIGELLGVHETAVNYWFRHFDLIPNKHYRFSKSRPQQEIYEFCRSIVDNVILNDRTIIYPKDVDVLCPDQGVAIELNGLYWHKEKPLQHLNKTQLLTERGYRSLQFWDTEWYLKQEICKSIIVNALGKSKRIYARQCDVRKLDNDEYRNFVSSNHISGYAPASIRYGLFRNNELVSAIGIGRSRFSKLAEYELVRACTLINHTVIGGLSKLLKHADITSLMSYCDRRLFSGNGYKTVGFNHSHDTKPNYFYWNERTKQTISRIGAQKHKLGDLLSKFDPALSEHQNMLENGWYRVYDCGNSAWVLPQS